MEDLNPYFLLLPLHEVEIPNEDGHLIVGVHIALSPRLVGVLVILDPDPLMVMMMVMMASVGSSGHCDAHPCKPFNHALVRRRSIALWGRRGFAGSWIGIRAIPSSSSSS